MPSDWNEPLAMAARQVSLLWAVALLVAGIREPERDAPSKASSPPLSRAALRALPARYWWVVALGAVFALARFSEAFFVLRAQQSGIPVALVPLVMVAIELVVPQMFPYYLAISVATSPL